MRGGGVIKCHELMWFRRIDHCIWILQAIVSNGSFSPLGKCVTEKPNIICTMDL